MRGHIKLGAVGALRDYMLVDVRQYLESTANQMAAQIGGGAGDYNDLQSWSAWVMDDWRGGLGKKDAAAGGFLYGDTETRYPNEIRLPKALTMGYHVDGTGLNDARPFAPPTHSLESSITIGTTQAVTRVGRKFRSPGAVTSVTVKLTLPNVVITGGITVALFSNSGGAPSSSLATASVTPVAGIGYSDYLATITYTTTLGTDYHIVIYPTTNGVTLTLPVFTTSVPATTFYNYNGSSWSATTAAGFIHEVRGREANATTGTFVVDFAAFGALIIAGDTRTNDQKVSLSWMSNLGTAYAATISDLLVLGDILLVGQGNSSNAYQVADDGSRTDLTVYGNKFAYWNGLVYRSVENDLYYSNDLSTWTGPISTCPNGWEIRGMAGHGDYLYISCDDGLYYLGYGDQILKVTNWASIEATNGKHMMNYHSVLYISAGEALFRWDGSNLLPMGLDLGEGLPANRSGTVAALVQQNNWLLCAINATSGQDSIWAYNDQGWHHVALLPVGVVVADMTYQRSTKRLHILTTTGMIFSVYTPDVAKEPASSSGWAAYGWVETDWFYGGLKEVQKDFESIYLSGENLASGQYVQVYWQDDDSTDWELLGTVTADRTELRWSDYTKRPNSRQIKLALALYTNNVLISPIVRAVRVKFLPMVTDWSRWRLPIQISDRQMMTDDHVNIYTAQQQRAHLKALSKQVPPVIFEDADGTRYEVKVVDASFQIDRYEYMDLIAMPSISGVYHVTVEQVTQAEYAGA